MLTIRMSYLKRPVSGNLQCPDTGFDRLYSPHMTFANSIDNQAHYDLQPARELVMNLLMLQEFLDFNKNGFPRIWNSKI